MKTVTVACGLAMITLAFTGAFPEAVAAQDAVQGEIELLQQANREEAAGDLDAAAGTLDRVLDSRPGSVPALLSLERVLRIQGRLEALVPAVEAALAADPASAILNELLVRTLADLDLDTELREAAEAWFRASGQLEVPYREVAATWAARGDYDRARATLERGRDAVGRPDALALELGDLYAELGDEELAAEEWGRAVDDQGRGLGRVRRRVRALPDGGANVVPGLVERLGGESEPAPRRRAALDLAVEAGLFEPVRRLTEGLLPELTLEEGRRLLEQVGRRADAAGRPQLGYWAYGRLLEVEKRSSTAVGQGRASPQDDGRLVAIRARVAQLALELGDTAAAASGYGSMEATLPPGSPERRQAAATRVELLALHDPVAAREALTSFRADHPDARETDGLAATVAGALLDAGRGLDAMAILADVRGPRTSRLRGRLALAQGDTETARTRYMEVAAGLRGGEATAALGLVTLLGRVSRSGGIVLGEAMTLLDEGRPGAAVDRVTAAVPDLDPADGAPLLAFIAAHADEAGLDADARALRERLIADYPRSPEAPEALLALGRSLVETPTGRAEARELLERLIIEFPNSALVPQARRALERIRQEAGA